MSDDETQTVPAITLRRGDHIHQTRENGRTPAGTATVLGVWIDDDGITVNTWTGDHHYSSSEPVTIDKREP
jgi:hypothetical protein